MDPATLSKVLNLMERPTLKPPTVTGYRCKLWGPYYPALLDGPSGAKVRAIWHGLTIGGFNVGLELPSHAIKESRIKG